jgi:hypothetical protein
MNSARMTRAIGIAASNHGIRPPPAAYDPPIAV